MPPSWISGLPLCQVQWTIIPLSCCTQKMGINPWNRESIVSTSWDTCTSGLQAAILDFWLPLTSDNILLSAIELAVLENMVVAFGISILSCLQAEIHALPVYRPPSWISDFRLRRKVLGVVPLRCWTPKMWGSRWNFVVIMHTSWDIRYFPSTSG
jgi:hypothetical protein